MIQKNIYLLMPSVYHKL